MSSIVVPAVGPMVDVTRACKLMADIGLDAIVANSLRNVFYLSGFPGFDYLIEPEGSSFAVLTANGEASVTVSMSERFVAEDFPITAKSILYGNYYIKQAPPTGPSQPSAFDALCSELQAVGLERGRVGFELELMPLALYRRLEAAFPAMTFADASPLFQELRTIKTSEEVTRVRTATEITEQAIDQAFAKIRAGSTERQIATWIYEGLIERGADPLYVTLGTNGRGAFGVCYPTDRPVKRGEMIRTDVSARFGMYHSDLGRCCSVGEPSSQQQEYYKIAYEALQAGIEAVSAGRPIGEVFSAGVEVPWKAGHTEFKRHHIGHGIGLQAHEWPFLKPNLETPIRAGMVLAVEVPYYVFGVGGFSPEDILVVTEAGTQLFSHSPPHMPVVG